MALDGLAVEIGSRTADVRTGISSVKRAFGSLGREAVSTRASLGTAEEGLDDARDSSLGLTASLVALANRADAAEGEIDSAGRSALTTSGMFSALSASTDGVSLSFGTLSLVTTASLIPAIVTLGSTLVPVVAALGGFVAILGSIGGVAILGTLSAIALHADELKTALTSAWESIQTTIAPAADLFAGVLEMLISDLPAVVEAAMPTQDVLRELAGGLLLLGETVLDATPGLVELATTLATRFLPAAIELVDGVLSSAPGFVMTLVDAFQDAKPELIALWEAARDLAPTLLEFGQNALDVVGPALVSLIGWLGQGMSFVNGLEGTVQDLTIAGLALAPMLSTIVSVGSSLVTSLGGLSGIVSGLGTALSILTGPIGLVIGALAALGAAYATNFGGFKDTVNSTVSAIARVITRQLGPAITAAQGIMRKLGDVIMTVWGAIRPVVEPVFSFLTQVAGVALINFADTAISVLTALLQFINGDFDKGISTLSDLFSRNLRRIANLINKWTNGALQGLVNDVIAFVNTLGKTLDQFLESIGQGDSFDFQSFEQVNIGTKAFADASKSANQTTNSSQSSGESDSSESQNVDVRAYVDRDGNWQAEVDKRVDRKSREQAKKARFQ